MSPAAFSRRSDAPRTEKRTRREDTGHSPTRARPQT
jgi:hypothetical protein